MIVPPSRKLAFDLSVENKWSIVQRRLPDLQRKAAESMEAKEELQQYCELIVTSQSENPRSHLYDESWDSRTAKEKQRKACLDHAAPIILEHGWMDLFWRLPAEQKTRPAAIRLLGRNICFHSVTSIEFELKSIIQCAKGIAGKYSVLHDNSVAFKDASPSTEQQQKFEECCTAAVKDVINQSSGLSRADMSALATIAHTYGIETVRQLIMSLPTNYTENLTEFVLQYTKQNDALSDPASYNFCQEVMDHLWHGFQYTGVHQQAMLAREEQMNRQAPYHTGTSTRPGTVQIESLTADELSRLLALAKSDSSDALLDALEHMTEAVVKANAKYVSERLMNFVEAILTHEVPPLIVEDNSDIYDSVSKYITTVLRDIITRWIGPQPQKPTNWSLPHKGCGSKYCDDCQHVAKFMSDSARKVLEYQVGVRDCSHLDNEFGDKYGQRAQCTTQIDRQKKPFTWRCTKVHRIYNEQLKTWTQRRKEVQAKLSRMGGKNGERLRIYLGDKTDALLRCRVEDLPSFEVALPLDDLHASALNVKNGKKSPADHGSGEHDPAFQAKRPRGISNDPVELSD